jgi:transcriptional regulator with XRE-family HTH domain
MDFKEATDLLSVPLERIAEALGKSYGTVLAYRTGDRQPPIEVRQRLAAFMRDHATNLLAAADEFNDK